MPLRVSGKDMDIGESLRTHVTEKVQTLIARYFDGKVSGHVVISPEGSAFRTDCSLHLSSGMNFQSEGRAHEPYASFEQAADKIERRLAQVQEAPEGARRRRRRASGGPGAARGRQIRHRGPGGGRRGGRRPISAPAVVAEGAQPLKVMSVASAVSELDLTGAPVVVFQHATSLRVNIVYRRRDGAIGWLDPR